MRRSDNQHNLETTVIALDKYPKARPVKHIKFVGVLGIFCVLFLASVFMLDTLFSSMFSTISTNDQIALANDTSSAIDEAADNNISKIENRDGQEGAIKNNIAMSESDFRQEAKHTIHREPDHLNIQLANLNTKAVNQNIIMNANFTNEDFRVEATHVLYRDESQ